MLYRKWKVKETANRQVDSLRSELGVDSLLAKVLLSRDVYTRQQATTKYLVCICAPRPRMRP